MTESGYQRSKLESGIRVVTERMPSLKSISLGIWFDVGSRHETAETNGISHFIEHMTFKGTATRSAREIAQSLESLGGMLNAFTSREYTCYYARLLDEHLDTALDILTDILTNSQFADEEVTRERQVILEEIKDQIDTPADIIHDHFAATTWDSHPLGRPIIGNPETVKAMDRERLLGYVHDNYTTDRIVVAAAGNVDHDHLATEIAKRLSFAGNQNGSKLEPPSYAKGRRKVFQRDSAQTHICLGLPTFAFADPQKYALLVVNTILGSGMGSRLFQSVRERHGLAYSIYTMQDYYHDTGYFSVYLATEAAKAAQAVELVLAELQEIKVNALTEEELATAKSQLKGNMVLSLESSYNRMSRMARHELFLRNFATLDETMAAINSVSLTQIQETVARIFDGEKLTLAALGPVDDSLLEAVNWSMLS
jgi:predicted Zn-dependent peptidase